MRYRTLGPLKVVRDSDIVDLGVLEQRALLALLLIHANEVVSTDRIIDELWVTARGGIGRRRCGVRSSPPDHCRVEGSTVGVGRPSARPRSTGCDRRNDCAEVATHMTSTPSRS